MIVLSAQQRAVAFSMSEADLERAVRRMIEDLGLWGYHVPDSRRTAAGWPDWVVLGPSGAIFRELKAERGRLTIEQRRVGSKLTQAGLDWSTWRPADLVSGVVAKQLAEIAGYKEAA